MGALHRVSLAFVALARASVAAQTDQQTLPYPAGWPAPNWTTVPTYTFCGPGKRPFNEAELDFISGKAAVGYTPRWMALGCTCSSSHNLIAHNCPPGPPLSLTLTH